MRIGTGGDRWACESTSAYAGADPGADAASHIVASIISSRVSPRVEGNASIRESGPLGRAARFCDTEAIEMSFMVKVWRVCN